MPGPTSPYTALDYGSAPGAGDGDPLRTLFQQIDNNIGRAQTDLAGKQPLDAGLTSLAGLTGTGVVEATATNVFTLRAIGVAASTDLLTRADGDGRFAALSHTHTLSQISDASSNGRSLVGAADYAAMRTLLGLGSAALLASSAFAAASHNHAAGEITSGVLAPARLGTGTADNTVFLRGDGVWALPAFAPSSVEFIVKSASTALSAERVATDSAEIAWGWGTSGQVNLSLNAGSVGLSKLATIAANTILGNPTGSDASPSAFSCTAAGRAMLAAGSAAAQAALLPAMVGASAGVDGTKGMVPAPVAGEQAKFLRADGTWATPAGGGGGSGTVTSVGLSAPSSLFTVSSSPVTSSGTIDLALATQAANRVFAGPSTGADAAPTFRALVAADIPSLTLAKIGDAGSAAGYSAAAFAAAAHNHAATDITSGILALARGGTGVDMSGTGGSGQVLKQKTAGGAVTVEALAAGDLPSHNHSAADLNAGTVATARLGSGTADNSTFLRGDQTWVAPPGLPDLFLYGDGSDGAFAADSGTAAPDWATKSGGQFTMTRDAYLTDLSGAGSIVTNGFTLFVSGATDFTGGLILIADGAVGGNGSNSGAGGTIPTALTPYTAGAAVVGSAGGAGAAAAGNTAGTPTNSAGNGGVSGTPGAGGNGSGGNGGSARAKATVLARIPVRRPGVDLRAGATLIPGGFSGPGGGGGGGNGTNSGGGGGAGGQGGHVVNFRSRTIHRGAGSATPFIRANAGNAGNGGSPSNSGCGGGGGGAGGGGGWVVVHYGFLTGSAVTGAIAANGGSGGNGGNGNGAGNGGHAGDGGNAGRVTLFNTTASTVASTDGTTTAGTAGGAASGTSGGAGGAGATLSVNL